MIEGLAGGLHGLLDIGAIAFGYLGQDLSGGGIVRWEILAGNGGNPLSVDQHFARLVDEFGDLRMDLGETAIPITTSFKVRKN